MRWLADEEGVALAEAIARDFNQCHEVGVRVTYWPGAKEGLGRQSRTRSTAWVMPNEVAVVKVEGFPGGISLDHVEVIHE